MKPTILIVDAFRLRPHEPHFSRQPSTRLPSRGRGYDLRPGVVNTAKAICGDLGDVMDTTTSRLG